MHTPRTGNPAGLTPERPRLRYAASLALGLLSSYLSAQTPTEPRTVALEVLTDDILRLTVDEGYVVHHGPGERQSEDELFVDPLDGAAAQVPATYTITSSDDPAYASGASPLDVDRKSKPTEFASFCDRFEADPDPRFENSCFNDRPDRAVVHQLYLRLPTPLTSGATYTVTSSQARVPTQTITYAPRASRSEAVHVNQLGYVPAAAEKFGYVYHWLGDGGPLQVLPPPEESGPPPPRAFQLVDVASGAVAFAGELQARKPLDNQELARVEQAPPFGNLLQAPTWECDFSAFATPGEYRLCVDGVGCSYPFAVADDVYREPLDALVEGLYQQRSGVATVAPYTSQPRPAPHRVGVTPGFAGRLKYSTVRALDYENYDAPASQKDAIDAAVLGPLEAWGWYQDAGDWDSYYSHTDVPAQLLWLYEIGADRWTDGQLDLPEAGNGLPDVLDEALWHPRFQQRLRAELVAKGYGTGGVGGGRVFGDLWGGDRAPDGSLRGSWEDTTRDWIVSGEDPMVTYKYAGLAAHAAILLAAGGFTDPAGVDWAAEAREAYAWAEENTLPGDEDRDALGAPFYHARFFGAANLYRLTGETAYEAQASADFDRVAADNPTLERHFGVAAYRAAADERPGSDPAVVAKVTELLVRDGRDYLVNFRDERAARWGGNYFLPVVVGQSTTPLVQPGILAHHFAPQHDPGNEAAYEAALYSTADYFLGNNPLNYVWISGLGERGPSEIFALDAWVLAGETPRPGIVPYGPVSQVYQGFNANGAFNFAWPLSDIYPTDENEWPMHELWFDQRQAPTTAEYTVHQNLAAAYLAYGYLYGLTAAGGNVLPVEWAAASAERLSSERVAVTWTTASERDVERFEVERRGADPTWSTVGTVSPVGASTYAFEDEDATADATYYRVRQVDLNGTATTSPTLIVAAVGEEPWGLSPATARDLVRVTGRVDGPLEILDAVGRTLARYPAGTRELAVGDLPVGTYWVRGGGEAREMLRVE